MAVGSVVIGKAPQKPHQVHRFLPGQHGVVGLAPVKLGGETEDLVEPLRDTAQILYGLRIGADGGRFFQFFHGVKRGAKAAAKLGGNGGGLILGEAVGPKGHKLASVPQRVHRKEIKLVGKANGAVPAPATHGKKVLRRDCQRFAGRVALPAVLYQQKRGIGKLVKSGVKRGVVQPITSQQNEKGPIPLVSNQLRGKNYTKCC